jgi:hypothetical protein
VCADRAGGPRQPPPSWRELHLGSVELEASSGAEAAGAAGGGGQRQGQGAAAGQGAGQGQGQGQGAGAALLQEVMQQVEQQMGPHALDHIQEQLQAMAQMGAPGAMAAAMPWVRGHALGAPAPAAARARAPAPPRRWRGWLGGWARGALACLPSEVCPPACLPSEVCPPPGAAQMPGHLMAAGAAMGRAMHQLQRRPAPQQQPAVFQAAALAGVRWLNLVCCCSLEQLLAAGGGAGGPLGGLTQLGMR